MVGEPAGAVAVNEVDMSIAVKVSRNDRSPGAKGFTDIDCSRAAGTLDGDPEARIGIHENVIRGSVIKICDGNRTYRRPGEGLRSPGEIELAWAPGVVPDGEKTVPEAKQEIVIFVHIDV